MSEYDVIFGAKVLDVRKIRKYGFITSEALSRMEGEFMLDRMRDKLTYALTAYVYEDSTERLAVTRRIVEKPSHATWKHHLAASLPHGSVRKAFICYLFNIPLDYVGRRRWHEIDLQRIAWYPKPREIPDLGGLVVNWYDSSRSGEEDVG